MNGMGGWFLLYKKIWVNPLFYSNGNAILVWIWLLSHCDSEGIVTCGRNQIAKDTGVNPETVRYWLTRFLQENHQLTTIKTTNKFSQFQVCNWKKYQRKTTNTSTQKLQATYQPPTTNKEERRKNNIYTSNFNQFWNVYPNKSGKKYAFSCWSRAQDKPAIEEILEIIEQQKKSDQWRKGYIPNPATWINQGRWEDEVFKKDSNNDITYTREFN